MQSKIDVVVSIICPVYNKSNFLGATISSVQKQTNPNWELLLVDDGSTDDSLKIVKEAASTDRRIRVLLRKEFALNNKGANVCRNIGLKHAIGEYVIFLDADDILLPFCIEQRLSAVLKDPVFDFYVFNVVNSPNLDRRPQNKASIPKQAYYRALRDDRVKGFFLRKFLSFDLPWNITGPIWKISFLIEIGGLSESLQRLQDPELHIRALLHRKVRFKYLVFDAPYDALRITDHARVVWNKEDFFRKQVQSVGAFLDMMVPTLLSQGRKDLLPHLQGYMLFVETLFYRYVRENPMDGEKMRSSIDIMYENDNIRKLVTKHYRLFLTIFKKLLVNPVINLKVPGLVLIIYKRVMLG